MTRTNDLLHLLNVQFPIVQAPMVGVSTPQLAAAVSNAGALGSIALGASTTQQAQEMIQATRALTDKPFNVNLFCHRPAVANPVREATWLTHLAPFFAEFGTQPPASLTESYKSFLANETMLDMLLTEQPSVVSFHFGLPPVKWIHDLHEAGITTLACATTPEEASLIEAAGVDVVIVQGVEAGGHRGVFDPKHDEAIGTFALIQLISKHSRLPIIAAGGIMDGQGIAAAMRLGAAAVQLGTAFILCPESSANAQYRAALQSERAYHTQITAAISGRPARGMVNRLFTDVDRPDVPALPDYPITYDATKALSAAANAQGNYDFAVQWAGQAASLARALPAAQLVETLVHEWHSENG
ncbi:MAG: nitronate monooxygenase [Anaerolineae bacterium]|nr:nitronate monooxygenase [Anaerolineae bacterium]